MAVLCAEARSAVHWFLDDELDTETVSDLQHHMTECAQCRAYLDHELGVRRTVQRAGRTVHAPVRLREQIQKSIRAEQQQLQQPWRRWVPVAATAMVLFSYVWHDPSYSSAAYGLEQAVLRHSHDLPMDVQAADMGQVQKYFSSKLPFAVQLPPLHHAAAVHGVGGRIVQVDDRDAAYVRLDTPRGRMSVFVYPDRNGHTVLEHRRYDDLAPARHVVLRHVNGFTAAQWRQAGLVYSVVTDLPEQELTVVLQRSLR